MIQPKIACEYDESTEDYTFFIYTRLSEGAYVSKLTIDEWKEKCPSQASLFRIPKSFLNRLIISRANGQKAFKKRRFNLPLSTKGVRFFYGDDAVRYKPKKEYNDNLIFTNDVVTDIVNKAKLSKDLSYFNLFQKEYKKYLANGGRPIRNLFTFFLDLVNN